MAWGRVGVLLEGRDLCGAQAPNVGELHAQRRLLAQIEEKIAAEEAKLATLPAPGATVIDAAPIVGVFAAAHVDEGQHRQRIDAMARCIGPK